MNRDQFNQQNAEYDSMPIEQMKKYVQHKAF